MRPICIVAAKRTPQGRFMGALVKRSAVDLAVEAGRAALEGFDPEQIDQVIIGNVVAAGQGMNIARQIAVNLGIPIERIAYTVNMMCGSGMQAVTLGAQAIEAGAARAVLCGGAESMSNAPHLLPRARGGYKFGDGALVDSLLRDGLVCTFRGQVMGLDGERAAQDYHIDRQSQDEFALRSQQNWVAAQSRGAFDDEIVPLKELDRDEHPRPETTLEQLAGLRPAFKPDGTVTAGNASGINDGAATLIVCDEQTASDRGWKPLAILRASASMGCDPALIAAGQIQATRLLCEREQCQPNDFEVIEINEAFAAQTLAFMRDLEIDPERVNPCGGAIALGHPIGASGARLIAHLAHRIARGEVRRALATVCIGGGMGSTTALETP